MAAVSTAMPPQGLLERVLPLAHWLGAEAAQGIERGQAKTRLICTLLGLGGFAAIWAFSGLPQALSRQGSCFRCTRRRTLRSPTCARRRLTRGGVLPS